MTGITEKLAEISRISGDGYHFINMRFMLEHFERQPDDHDAQEVLEIVDRFYRLCKYVENKG